MEYCVVGFRWLQSFQFSKGMLLSCVAISVWLDSQVQFLNGQDRETPKSYGDIS